MARRTRARARARRVAGTGRRELSQCRAYLVSGGAGAEDEPLGEAVPAKRRLHRRSRMGTAAAGRKGQEGEEESGENLALTHEFSLLPPTRWTLRPMG